VFAGAALSEAFKPSEEKIGKLDAIEGERRRISIFNEPSLYLQVSGHPGSPVISWIFRYRTAAGKQVNHTIGRWPEVSWAEVRTVVTNLRAEVLKGKRLEPTRQEKQAAALREKAELLNPTPAPPDPAPG
jgi:hypothetical protein